MFMFKYTKEQLDDLAWDIAFAFEWSQTPQGYDYWDEVYKNLKKLSEEKDEHKKLSA